MGLELSDVVATESELSFVLKPPNSPKFAWAYYTFSRTPTKDWTGTLTQMKQTFPATLKAGQGESIHRPQTPEPPFSYNSKEVIVPLTEQGVQLAGTFTVPGDDLIQPGKGWPTVVFITGSGSQDRDETIMDHKPFAVLADHLARSGVASLRVDDRGVGGSTGARADLTTLDFASDIAQVVSFVKGQETVDVDKVGVLGHSEGGLIAAMVGAEVPLSFVISLAGTGVNGLEVLIEQNLDLLGVEDVEARTEFRTLYSNAMSSEMGSELEREHILQVIGFQERYSGQNLSSEHREAGLQQFEQVKQSAWMQTFMTVEPSTYWSKVTVPTLILNGSKDRQVSSTINLPAIQHAIPDTTLLTVKEVEGVNHLFQQCETGSISEYGMIEQTIDPLVLDLISSWILDL
jgi:pimeloyl-ACP methyl ester carboxylesterase